MATRVGDEIVLVHLGTDKIYVLNRTGARLWELLTAACDRQEIERRLSEEFDVPPGDLAADIDALVASLAESKLIVGTP